MSPTDPPPSGEPSHADEPTKPLPTTEPPAATPTDPVVAPVAAEQVTEPLVAPHVPVADVSTAQMDSYASAPARQGSGTKRVLVVGLVAVAAAVIAVLGFGALQLDGIPAPAGTTAPPAAPSPSATAEDDGGTVVAPDPEPAPVDPTPVEPTPEPEPTTPPPADPTPAPTEPAAGG